MALSQPETSHSVLRAAHPLRREARTILVSMNPKAGFRARRAHVGEITATLRMAHFSVLETTSLAELTALSTYHHAAGDLRAVVAIGGDGTASIVRRHVPLEVPMLAVPMGTENLLGRYLRQSIAPAEILDNLTHGVVADFDLGRAGGQPFLLMFSAGFDAEVIRVLHENRRGNISRATYAMPILQSMYRYYYPPMRLYWGDSATERAEATNCRWLFAFNLPLYAFGLPIAPAAVGTDGLLDVCAFERGFLGSAIRYLWHVFHQSHRELADVANHRATCFRVESAEGAAIGYQLDGDYAGTLPVDVEVLPRQLRLVVSRFTAQRLGFQL